MLIAHVVKGDAGVSKDSTQRGGGKDRRLGVASTEVLSAGELWRLRQERCDRHEHRQMWDEGRRLGRCARRRDVMHGTSSTNNSSQSGLELLRGDMCLAADLMATDPL